jgi:hypothetical protein
MKTVLMKLIVVVALLAASCWRAEASGTWSPLTNPAPAAFSNCLLLSDGTLIGADGGSSWYRLTPDSHGSYANGTWSQIAPMNDTRLYYAAQVLTDGRVYVAGGEDGTGHGNSETYNPLTNVWTLTSPGPFSVISDAISALLPNGDVLQSDSQSSAAIYHPTTDTWSPAATPGDQNEADWVKLPDDSILTIIAYGRNTQRYIPSQNTWVSEPSVPVDMYNNQMELGSSHLLPNGKVFWLGGTGNTVIYTPTGNTNPGSWVTGPVIPNGDGANDAPAAMMANGKILCAFSDSTTSFGSETFFYEYDYTTNSFTQIPDPNHTANLSDPIETFATSMLDLPDGSVFYCGANGKSYIYTPDGTQLTAGKPVITSVTKNADGSYHLIGTGLNGLSEGAKYGDDKQMNTNYPIVHLTDNTTGNVYYARTDNWTSTGVRTGSKVIATEFTLPAGLPPDPYSLVVSANGLASDPGAFFLSVAAPAFSPPAGTYTSAQTVTITSATSGAMIAYTTDGSTPTEVGGTVTNGIALSNGGSVSIGTTTTLQAIAFETGFADSSVTPGNYTIGVTLSSSNGFYNIAMASSQSGTFTVTFDASPSLSPSNTVIALSKGAQTAYTGLACIARFNTSGDIDAYNGTAYQAASVIPYSKALTYHFRLVVNVPANTYSVYVTPPGGSELTVGLNYKFRNAVTSLDTWTIDVNATPGGSVTESNLSVSGSGGTVAAPSFSPGAGTYSTAQTVLINDTTSGATIRYTTDGVTTPTETVGTLYTGSISISTTTKLEAIAYETGMTDSTVTSGQYTISPPQVAAPTFSPGAGTYTSAQTVTISTMTSGASIRYTTDGVTTPTETVGTLYSGSVSISATTKLEAIAYKTGMTDSTVTIGQYTITSNRTLTGSSGNGFHALALTAAQAGTFTATFDATPSVSPENAVIGLSKGVATAYTGLSCIARFNPTGQIDAYNGTGYGTSIINYSAGVTYHFRLVVNVTAHTYSVYVTPAGGSELTVGLNYAFRVTQTSLDTWNLDLNATPSGCSLTANNLNP